MLSLAEARSIIAEHVRPLDPVTIHLKPSPEFVDPEPLNRARGRILRQDVLAPEDMPAFDRSAMDGYAIDADDHSERFRVVMEVQAGQSPTQGIGRGECARIFTGAQIPPGASQVIMQEDVEREGEWMILRRRDAKMWIRRRGEDARAGDLLLAAGARLRAGELSLLAQIGLVQPLVSGWPTVLHLTTGNELVDPRETPGPGQIRDSNATLIAALLEQAGAHRLSHHRCGDDLAELVRQIEKYPSNYYHVLLISGGASVGDYDFGPRALAKLGFTIHFRAVNIRPGKPLVFATRERVVAFVIPGNPVSHFVTFQLAIRLALERLEGASPVWDMAKLELAEDLLAKPNDRETWWPARVLVEEGVLRACPLAWQSSGDLRGLLGVNALLPIAPGASGAKKGTAVDCLLIGAVS
jgi:molybdopterin molybdotransferase